MNTEMIVRFFSGSRRRELPGFRPFDDESDGDSESQEEYELREGGLFDTMSRLYATGLDTYLDVGFGINSFIFCSFIAIWQVISGTFLSFHALLALPSLDEKSLFVTICGMLIGLILFAVGVGAMQALGQESHLNYRLLGLSTVLLIRGLLLFYLALTISVDIHVYAECISVYNHWAYTLELPQIGTNWYSTRQMRSFVITYPFAVMYTFIFAVFDIYSAILTCFHYLWVKNQYEYLSSRNQDVLSQLL